MKFVARLVNVLCALAQAPQTHWERLGGTALLRKVVDQTVTNHLSDPITKVYFGKTANGGTNIRSDAQIYEHVYGFLSAGLGGPDAYTGRDMVTAHKHMKLEKHAFEALTGHLYRALADHGKTPAEIAEVYDIVNSMYGDVMYASHYHQDPARHNIVIGVVIAGLLSFAVLLVWRQSMALDSASNNLGIAQWSSLFYQEGWQFLNALPYLLNLVPLATVFLGIYIWEQTGDVYWTFSTWFIGFVVLPILDMLIGEDSYNPTKKEEEELKENWWFSAHMVLYCWLYTAALFWTASYIGEKSGFTTSDGRSQLPTAALIGISTTFGIASGFGIGCIHELCHRPSFFLLGHCRMILMLTNYNHFWVEHLFGHHKRVATDEDPAASALNEPLWTFIWKCLYNSFRSALEIEGRYQKSRGRGFWTLHNRIVIPYLFSFAVDYLIYKKLGPEALIFHLIQSFFTAFLTDNTNYIEHYGLRRQRLSDKKDDMGWYSDYERPTWMHAWNTGDRLTNYVLFKIERHPDHHVNAGRPYQILRTFKETPTYPTGYAGMIALSWFPPLFFAVMNPLVRKYNADLAEMRKDGRLTKIFPNGANNISSAYKTEGEDFYEKEE